MSWLPGWYGPGMHGFVLDEAMLGFRVACWLNEEQVEGGMAWWVDLQYAEYVRAEEAALAAAPDRSDPAGADRAGGSPLEGVAVGVRVEDQGRAGR